MMQYLPGLQRPKSAPNNASMAGLDDGLSQGHRQASNGVLMLARLPLAKLLLLGVRQAARPVSKVATAAAARSEIFQDCCAGAARMMKSDRLNMPQEQAVQAGCVMVGETVVFGVTGGVLTWEYHKSKEAERQKEHMAREELRSEALAGFEELRLALQEQKEEVARQGAEIIALRRREAHRIKIRRVEKRI
ncbi:unnamed protein product [Polarella glacialis]|uniref:OPA3-like protein n=1 Tax=Polarella glacialis TaxID=89957 RepID=A0A813ISK1_POLGL|nr:unnamed protein product [Polarella glacialis]